MKFRCIYVLIVISIAAAGLFLFLPQDSCRAATLHVGGIGAGNYTAVQDAINDSSDGDTVYVYNGTYNETLTVNRTISLIGEDATTTIIDGNDNGYNIITIQNDSVNVSGFTLRNTSFITGVAGIYILGNESNISNNIVCDIGDIFTIYGYGILPYYTHNHTIYNNTIYSIDALISFGIYSVSCPDINVSQNNISGNASTPYLTYGLVMEYSNNSNIWFNTIGNHTTGIWSYISRNNTYQNNSLFNDSFYFFGITVSHYNNTVENNSVNGKPVYFYLNSSGGICPTDAGAVILVNCTQNQIVNNNNISEVDIGIHLVFSDNITISNSIISNAYEGIYLDYSDHCSIYDNIIRNNTIGVEMEVSNHSTLYLNSFLNNTYHNYQNDTSTNTWYNSTLNHGNYWDNYTGSDTNGDGIGDTPFNISFCNDQDLYPLINQRTSPPSVIWIDDDYTSDTPGWNTDHYAIVQRGLENISTNGLVFVQNGTYLERIYINTSTTLRGAGQSIVDAESVNTAVTISANHSTLDRMNITHGTNGVDVSNLSTILENITISNNAIYENTGHGVRFRETSNGSIISNTINKSATIGIGLEISSNNNTVQSNSITQEIQFGISLSVSSDNNTITNNTVTNTTDDGFQAQNSNSITLNSNTFTNIGDDGISFFRSSNNSITNNTLTNISSRGIGVSTNSNSNHIESNTINTTTAGILIIATSTHNIISNNTLANDPSYGIILSQTSSTQISLNNITNATEALFLLTVDNTTIQQNTIFNNSKNGINLTETSVFNTILLNNIHNNTYNGTSISRNSDNNTFFFNNFTNNSDNGVNISNSFNNTFYYNNFRHNTLQAYDDSNNSWFNSTISKGNYWNDYDEESEGAYDSNSDNIIDSPYNITGGTENDSYPLTEPYDHYHILKISTDSEINEGNTFIVTIQNTKNTPIEAATVSFNSATYETDSQGQTISITAPTVSSDTIYQITVEKTYYIGNSTTITVKNIATGGGSTPPISTNTVPTADANGPYTGSVNQLITFDGSASSDPDGDSLTYSWNFGDGATGEGVTPTHSYSSQANYAVTLTVSDGSLTDTYTTYALITELPEDTQPPVADPNGPYTGLTYQIIYFDASASTDPDGEIMNYTWDFGDNTQGYGIQPSHSYKTAGTYKITLTVKDTDNLTDSTLTNATIQQDTDADGWSDELEQSYQTNYTDATIFPQDTDKDGIPDDDSPDGNYTGDTDDDNDGVSDETEIHLGSNPKDPLDVHLLEISGSSCYLIDTDTDGIHDTCYISEEVTTSIGETNDDNLLLDTNGDGDWDYEYNPTNEKIKAYVSKSDNYLLIIAVSMIAIIVLVFVFYKRRKI